MPLNIGTLLGFPGFFDKKVFEGDISLAALERCPDGTSLNVLRV